MDSYILSDMIGGVLVLTLNRPDKLNALTPEMSYRFRDALRSAARDPEVRAVLIRGAGKAFCSGGDVTHFASIDPHDPVAQRCSGLPAWNEQELAAERLRERAENALLLHAMPKPTVAMVRGPAMGAGLSLAAACDFRIASDTAVFATAFAKVGVSGDYGASYFLGKLVGPAKAREMFFLGDKVKSVEALRLGLVTRIVTDTELDDAALAFATRLAGGPPVAWRYIKQNLIAAETGSLSDVLDLESRNMIRTLATADSKAAITGFLEKKAVSFAGV